MPEFTCEACGERFSLAPAVIAKYPNWTPRTCMACRGKTPAASARAPAPARASAPRRDSGTRTTNLSTAAILARFEGGPDTGVFTDGSCQGNPGPGGWGAVRVANGRVVDQRWGSEPATTNNRMELTAIIEGLLMLGEDEAADIYSDSQLVVNTLTKWAAAWEKNGWKRREGEVKNLELVQRAFALAKARPRARIRWIRAHDGSRWNEYADSLSQAYLRDVV